MNSRQGSRVAAIAVVGVILAANARADFITGYGWISTETIVSGSPGATVGALALPTCHNGVAACTTGNADVTFTTTGVSFNNVPPYITPGTIGAWLASSAFPLNGVVDTSPSSNLDPTIWEFVGNISVTGTLATPQTFSFLHDDGVTFIVNGQTVINAPGATGPATTTGFYTGGANGNAPFTLIYAECCAGQAALVVSLLGPSSAPVPEPISIGLVGIGLAGLGLAAGRLRRRRV